MVDNTAHDVAPGTWSISLPIPGPLRTVNVYALETDDGVLLVDAGLRGDAQLDILARGLGALGAGLADVVGIVVTHAHSDHYSLAMQIRDASGCWTALHPADASFIEEMVAAADGDDHPIAQWGRRWGARPDETARAIATMDRAFSDGLAFAPERLLEDGEELVVGGRTLRVVHTPGHTPGHVCVVEPAAGLAFVGDHVLGGGRPSLAVGPGSTPDPLHDHVGALRRLLPYEELEALPGHGGRFPLGTRVTGTLEEHRAQLALTLAHVAAAGSTVRDVAAALPAARDFESLGGAGKYLWLGETHAYLAALEQRGDLVRVGDLPLRWRRVEAA